MIKLIDILNEVQESDWSPFEQSLKQELTKQLKYQTDNYRLTTDLNGRAEIVNKEKMSIDDIANHYINGCQNIFNSYEDMKEYWEDIEGDKIAKPSTLAKVVVHTSKDALINDNSALGKHVAFLMIDDGITMDVYRQVSDLGIQTLATAGLNEAKKEEPKIGAFEEFAETRGKGAEKITNNAKEKGGPSMLTYHHFVVKLPYYKKAAEGKLDLEKAHKEYKELIKQLHTATKTNMNIDQTAFQKLVGKIEVLGELLIKHK